MRPNDKPISDNAESHFSFDRYYSNKVLDKIAMNT